MSKRRLAKLYIDQHGERVWARTIKELCAYVGRSRGSPACLLTTPVTGHSFHVGYVVGQRWFNEFTPTRELLK